MQSVLFETMIIDAKVICAFESVIYSDLII